jgi:ligand-binding SRPBCC domain-containing protein
MDCNSLDTEAPLMPVISLETHISAPIEIVFDLSRSIDLHVESTAQTNERAVAGRTSGLIGLGEDVTWEATHFGVRQQLTTKITQYDRPHHFCDSMVSGAFSRFDHDHHFVSAGTQTLMKDAFDYNSPFALLGQIADALFLKRYMTRLLQIRNDVIKSIAESGEAEPFLARQITEGDPTQQSSIEM